MATTIFGDESTSPKKTIFGDQTSPQRQDEDSEGMFWDGTALGELGEGVVSGGIGIVEGLSAQSPRLVILSVDTAASASPAAASSLAARPNLSALVRGVFAKPRAALAAIAALPTLDATPTPGTTN